MSLTATSERIEASIHLEESRLRMERLLQILAGDFDLRFGFGERDRLADGEIVIAAKPASIGSADDRLLKGQAFHLLGHYLYQSGQAAEHARRHEATIGPHFTRLWHVLEDARVETFLMERWPGMRRSLDAKLPPNLGGRLVQLATRTQQIELGLYLQGRGIEGAQFSPTVVTLLDQTREAVRSAANSQQSADVLSATTEIYPILAPHLRGELSSPPPLPIGRHGDHDVGEQSGEVEPGHEGEPNIRAEEDELFGVGVLEANLQLPDWYRPGSAPWYEEGVGDKAVHPSVVQSDKETILLPHHGDRDAYRQLRAEVQQDAGFLAHRLTRLIEENLYLRYAGSYRSGKLNMAKLWKQRTGAVRLFQRRIRPSQRHIAFSLLIDESASMKAGDKIQVAAKAAVLLGEAFAPLHVPLEIIGFSTDSFEAQAAMQLGLKPAYKYRTTRCSRLEHRIYKHFGEPFRSARYRLTGLQSRHNNWDEEHLLFAVRRLQAQRADRHVLIVISDGQPNGDARHLKETVTEIQRLGTEVVGVGIGADYVARIYSNAIVVKGFRQLAEAIVDWVSKRFRQVERMAA